MPGYQATRRVQLTSRNPENAFAKLKQDVPIDRLLPPVKADITDRSSLEIAFKDADAVVSLVGILHGPPQQFEKLQWHGAENVAAAAKAVGAKLIHISAIGADKESNIPYARTKALGEEAVRHVCKDATIIRPSIVFGPGDGFFAVGCSKLDRVPAPLMFAEISGLLHYPSFCPSCQSSVEGRQGSNLCMLAMLRERWRSRLGRSTKRL